MPVFTAALRPLAPALTTLLLASPAIGATEGDRQDTRVNEEAWETRFIGRYGADDGSCDDEAADVWVLSAFAVDAGSVRCQDIGKMTWSDDGLVVPLSACRDGAIEVEDREIIFNDAGEDEITATTPEGKVSLRRCK
ncbi:hypothetical protein K1T73_17225 [Roseovarius sp. SCSIO 43702]|uniref:hypothetical protein n=1 Tax=Roseovarius sp. SCSIO 43702 TaxID=2823043 RepID=UPI001C731977|nr:hypothetical protein [Roseovarius sp. SCSIO 43702]QYX56750.1 hypothetical protein K1T73_17225 [Roseovarius sp. SCSIO 43702]